MCARRRSSRLCIDKEWNQSSRKRRAICCFLVVPAKTTLLSARLGCPAVLDAVSRCGTRCVRYAHSAQTTAASQITLQGHAAPALLLTAPALPGADRRGNSISPNAAGKRIIKTCCAAGRTSRQGQQSVRHSIRRTPASAAYDAIGAPRNASRHARPRDVPRGCNPARGRYSQPTQPSQPQPAATWSSTPNR